MKKCETFSEAFYWKKKPQTHQKNNPNNRAPTCPQIADFQQTAVYFWEFFGRKT